MTTNPITIKPTNFQELTNTMKPCKSKRAVWTIAVAAAVVLQAGTALAAPRATEGRGVALTATQLPAAARAQLQHEIDGWRVSHPGAFRAVAQVKGCSKAGYENNRNPQPECFRELKALGGGVVLPMLSALVFDVPQGLASTPAERTALTVGLLRAVGVARDPRAAPVLKAVFEQGAEDVRGEAAEALGRLGGDAELAVLTQHSVAGDPLRLAALQGLGECKRLAAAKVLATQLAGHPDETATAITVRSLGNVASSWAWKAMVQGKKATEAEGLQVRTTAAQALVPAFAWASEANREEIAQALQMAQHPQSAAWLAAAKTGADAATARAYEALAARLAKHSR